MVAGHLVLLAALLMQAHPPAPSLDEVILHLHLKDRVNAREGVDHDPDQRPVAQADQGVVGNGVEQRARLAARPSTGVLPFLTNVFWAAHGVRRVGVDDLASHQPIEQHADGGQVLLHRRRGELPLQVFDEGRDMECLHLVELVQAAGRRTNRRNAASR